MTTWNRTLTAAGIHAPALRRDYTAQRGLIARYRRNAYTAVRLLLPTPLIPHVVAATAFMHHTDNILDAPTPREDRVAALAGWRKQVHEALTTGQSDDPVLRPLLHTITGHPRLHTHVEDFIANAETDLDFSGFAREADYEAYVDSWSLPAFMLVACLIVPEHGIDLERYRQACRTHIDGSQRLDFVNDLSEDLPTGRLGIAEETLERHSVTRADLEQGRDTPGTRELLREELTRARRTLESGRGMTDLVPPAHQPLVRALTSLEELTADAALAKGAALLREPAGPFVPAALRVLVREYLRFRLRPRQAGAAP